MATGDGIVVKLANLEPIEGADNIVQAKLYGETIVVSKDEAEGTLGVLFDIETALDKEYLRENNLFRHEELNKDVSKKGYFDNNGRVRPIKLKGVKVSAFFMPVESLYYTGVNKFKEGELVKELNGHKICSKYMPPTKATQQQGAAREKTLLMFKEHFDTEQLLRSLNDVPIGSFVITTKLHGTSGRYGKVLEDYKPKWWERLFKVTKLPQWKNAAGSRRVVKSLSGETKADSHYYDSDIWTKVGHEVFGDRLLKGETVYFEIVGYIENTSIMPSHSAEKLKSLLPKDEYNAILNKYGKEINYTYGCKPSEYDVYIYRITHTNIDGDSFDLPWEAVKIRSEKLGIKHVPEITIGRKHDKTTWEVRDTNGQPFFYTDVRDVSDVMEKLASSADWKETHPEGICLRSEAYPICKIWKHKAQNFKLMEYEQRTAGVITQDESN